MINGISVSNLNQSRAFPRSILFQAHVVILSNLHLQGGIIRTILLKAHPIIFSNLNLSCQLKIQKIITINVTGYNPISQSEHFLELARQILAVL